MRTWKVRLLFAKKVELGIHAYTEIYACYVYMNVAIVM